MSTDDRIRVMIADDHSVVRVGPEADPGTDGASLRLWVRQTDGEEAVRLATEVSPDVIVMDVMMPKKDGVEAAGRSWSPHPRLAC